VRTESLASAITVDVYETGDSNWPTNPEAAWDESHDLTGYLYDTQCYSWDEWAVDLDDVASSGDVVSGETTLWDCSFDDDGSLAFLATVYDDSTPAVAVDCAIWGYDAEGYFIDHLGKECDCLDEDENCSD
jgi:hypothetical protein